MSSIKQQTLARIQQGMQDGVSACLPELLRIVETLLAKVPELAVQELADLIKNDTVVLERVIHAANSVGYNPSGVQISSVGEAIQIIGFDRVRSLSMALILLENSHAWQYSEERRKATLTSLAAGLLAQQLAPEVGVNPELAFICGALRGFGRILMATYLVGELRQISTKDQEVESDAAYVETFGMTPLELGHHLMKASHMSPLLLRTLRKFSPDAIRGPVLTPEQKLLGLTNYAYELSAAVTDNRLSDSQFKARISSVRRHHEIVIEQSDEALRRSLERLTEHLEQLSKSCGQEGLPDAGVDCVRKRVAGQDPPPPVSAAPVVPVPMAQEHEEMTAAQQSSRKRWREGIDRLEQLVAQSGGNFLTGPMVEELLATVRGAFDAEEAWLFLPDPVTGGFLYRSGLGMYSNLLAGRARIRPNEPSVFGLCLARRESVFIHNAKLAKIANYLPTWYRDKVALDSFILLCMQRDQQPVGLIFVGWRAARQVEVHREHAQLIRHLLRLVGGLKACP